MRSTPNIGKLKIRYCESSSFFEAFAWPAKALLETHLLRALGIYFSTGI